MGHTKYITHQAKYILDRKYKDIFNKIIQSSMDMSKRPQGAGSYKIFKYQADTYQVEI